MALQCCELIVCSEKMILCPLSTHVQTSASHDEWNLRWYRMILYNSEVD